MSNTGALTDPKALAIAVLLSAACAPSPRGSGQADSGEPSKVRPVEAGVAPARCSFDIDARPSPVIGTVGIVSFTTEWGTVAAGHIEFGTTPEYGQRAPLDLVAPDHRTLLLGMTARSTYHFRIAIEAGGARCVSEDQELTTGPLPPGLPTPTLLPPAAEDAPARFLVTPIHDGGGAGDRPGTIAIFDQQGRPVWWVESPMGAPSRARLSWDAKHLYLRDANPNGSDEGRVVRISLDGLEQVPIRVPSAHHDLSVTPDGGVLFLTRDGTAGCDRVTKLGLDGTLTPFFDLAETLGDRFVPEGTDPCHCNSIHYVPSQAAITFSCLNLNAYFRISEAGELDWVLGGSGGLSDFGGVGAAWNRQHGHHLVAEDRLVFFNNGVPEDSLAVEVELDFETMRATRVWSYDGGHSSITLGDVQRLGDGNTLVTYSNAGVIHEVDGEGVLLQTWQFGSGIGYVEHRRSLYGAPDLP